MLLKSGAYKRRCQLPTFTSKGIFPQVFEMSDPIILIYSTWPSLVEAKNCAKSLVEEKLIACANILPPITSIYKWQGSMQEDQEIAMIFKTTASQLSKIEEKVLSLHSYQTPCLVSLPADHCSKGFSDWILQQVSPFD